MTSNNCNSPAEELPNCRICRSEQKARSNCLHTLIDPNSATYMYFCDTTWGPFTHTASRNKENIQQQKQNTLSLTASSPTPFNIKTKDAEKICRSKDPYLWWVNVALSGNDLLFQDPPRDSKQFFKCAEEFALYEKLPTSKRQAQMLALEEASNKNQLMSPSASSNAQKTVNLNIDSPHRQQQTVAISGISTPSTPQGSITSYGPLFTSTPYSSGGFTNTVPSPPLNNTNLVPGPFSGQTQVNCYNQFLFQLSAPHKAKPPSPQHQHANILVAKTHQIHIQTPTPHQQPAAVFSAPGFAFANVIQPSLNVAVPFLPSTYPLNPHPPPYLNGSYKELRLNTAIVQQQQCIIGLSPYEMYIYKQLLDHRTQQVAQIISGNSKIQYHQQQYGAINNKTKKFQGDTSTSTTRTPTTFLDVPFRNNIVEQNPGSQNENSTSTPTGNVSLQINNAGQSSKQETNSKEELPDLLQID